MAPSRSFAATPGSATFAVGQAAFTVTVAVLFNLLAPVGWKVGVLRIEDVALGCGVSVRRDRWAGVGIRHHIVPTGNSSPRISGLGRKKSSRNGDPQAPMILLTTLAV